jgi:pantothenate kinase type III
MKKYYPDIPTEQQERDNLLAIDIGNSRIKLLYQNEISSIEIKDQWQNKIKSFLITLNNTLAAGISSVNIKVKEQVERMLTELKIPIINCKDILSKQSIIDFSQISGMGDDRKLGLIGAIDYEKPPLITIDIGTAVTINLLDKDRICRGGLIFPGPYTQVKSLANDTSDLELIEIEVTAQINAFNTQTAISNGIIYGIYGSVKEIIRIIQKQNPDFKNAKIIMTGGGATLPSYIMIANDFKFILRNDLVLKGIIKLLG